VFSYLHFAGGYSTELMYGMRRYLYFYQILRYFYPLSSLNVNKSQTSTKKLCIHLSNIVCFYSDNILMAQSQGYKRFRSSIDTIHHGTSTPQTSSNKIFPRASTPNRRSIERIEQQTIPVPSPRPKVTVHHKIHKKRRQPRSNHHYQIHIDHIILVQQQQKKSCSRCHCKKTKSQQILGVL
jgi:hypothetical protein